MNTYTHISLAFELVLNAKLDKPYETHGLLSGYRFIASSRLTLNNSICLNATLYLWNMDADPNALQIEECYIKTKDKRQSIQAKLLSMVKIAKELEPR